MLDADNRSRAVIDIALEVDDTVLLLVSAAAMTNGDAAVAVTAGMLLLRVTTRLSFGGELGDLIKGDGTVMPRRPGAVGLYLIVAIYPFTSSVQSLEELDRLRARALRVTIAFFQAAV